MVKLLHILILKQRIELNILWLSRYFNTILWIYGIWFIFINFLYFIGCNWIDCSVSAEPSTFVSWLSGFLALTICLWFSNLKHLSLIVWFYSHCPLSLIILHWSFVPELFTSVSDYLASDFCILICNLWVLPLIYLASRICLWLFRL